MQCSDVNTLRKVGCNSTKLLVLTFHTVTTERVALSIKADELCLHAHHVLIMITAKYLGVW